MSHLPCAGGCGQLADECRCANSQPLGSMVVDGFTVPDTAAYLQSLRAKYRRPAREASR